MEGSRLGRGRAERLCIRRTVLLCPELGREAGKEAAGDRVPTHPCGPDESRAGS